MKSFIFIISLILTPYYVSAQLKPFFKVDTDMHTAPINCISSDSTGNVLVTCSNDKTAKIWNSDGSLLKTIRVPINDGENNYNGNREGVLTVCAISPDSKIIAVGGFTGIYWNNSFCIYIYETYSGKLLQKIGGFSNPIDFIKFSPTGKIFAVGVDEQEIKFYSAEDFKYISNLNFLDQRILDLDFSNNGNLAIACYNYLKIYDINNLNKPIYKQKVKGINSVSYNYWGDKIAYTKNGVAEVLDIQNKKIIYTSKNVDFYKICFSGTNDNIFIISDYWINNLFYVKKFQEEGRFYDINKGFYEDNNVLIIRDNNSDNKVYINRGINNICTDRNGGVFFSREDTSWNRMVCKDSSSVLISYPSNILNFLEGKKTLREDYLDSSISISVIDGNMYSFNLLKKLISIKEDILLNDLQTDPHVGPRYSLRGQGPVHVSYRSKEYKFDQIINNYADFEGKYLKISNNIYIQSSDDNIALVKIKQNSLKDYLKSKVPHEEYYYTSSEVLNIIPSNNKNYFIVSFSDGTIKWFSVYEFKEVLSLFLHANGHWVLWTPDGFYDCSLDGGEKLITIHENIGLRVNARSISYESTKYYNPGKINEVINSIYNKGTINKMTSPIDKNIKDETKNAKDSPIRKGNLNILAIGVGTIDNMELLSSPENDVNDMIDIANTQSGYYPKINQLIGLLNIEATKENILNQLRRLEVNSNVDDVSLIYFSGHGEKHAIDSSFYFPLINDAIIDSLTSIEIAECVKRIKGIKILIMDACYSGEFIEDFRDGGYLSEDNIVILSSSNRNEKSLDMYDEIGNSIYTHSFILAVNGAASAYNSDIIILKNLVTYIEHNVRMNTNWKQNPQSFIPDKLKDIELFKVTKK